MELFHERDWLTIALTRTAYERIGKGLTRSKRELKTLALRAYTFSRRLDLKRPEETMIPAISRRYHLSSLGFSCNHSPEFVVAQLSIQVKLLVMEEAWERFQKSIKSFEEFKPKLCVIGASGNLSPTPTFKIFEKILGRMGNRIQALDEVLSDKLSPSWGPLILEEIRVLDSFPQDISAISTRHTFTQKLSVQRRLDDRFSSLLDRVYEDIVDAKTEGPPPAPDV